MSNRSIIRWHPRAVMALATVVLSSLAPGHAAAQLFDSPRGYYEDATRLISTQNDNAAALIQLRNALQLDPAHVPSLILMGQTLLAQGRSGEAQQLLSDALMQGADPVLVLIPLTEAYLIQGRYAGLLRDIPADSAPQGIRADIHAARAHAHLALGNVEEAGIALDSAFSLSPDNHAATLVQVSLDIRQGRFTRALEGAGSLVETHPDDPHAWNTHASALHATGQIGPAIAAYRKAVDLAPWNSDARIALVSLYMDQGREADAIDDIRYLEENAPYDPRGAYFRALAAARSGDRKAELEALTTAIVVLDALEPEQVSGNPQLQMIGALAHFGQGAYGKARELLEDYLANHPVDIGATRLLASSLLALEDYRGVINLLAPMQRRNPDDGDIAALLAAAYSSSGQPRRAADLLQSLDGAGAGERASDRLLATSLLDAGSSLRGMQLLERLRERNPASPGINLPLAVAYLRDERWSDAIAAMDSLLESSPDEPNYRNLLGVAELGRGNRDLAVEVFEGLVAAHPDFLPARVNLARIQLAAGDVAGARRLLDEGLAVDPDSHRAMSEQARLHLTQGELDDALRWAERAVQGQPGEIDYRRLLVEIHLQRNDAAAAEEAARRASSDNADNPDAGLLLARTEARVGKTGQAELTCRRLVRDADFDTALLHRIAQLQAELGAYEAALYSLSNALKGDPVHLPSRVDSVRATLALGRFEQALADAESLAGDFPDAGGMLLLRGEAQLGLGQYRQAAEDFMTARDMDNSPEASLGLLRTYRAAGRESELRSVLEAYFAGGGTDPRLRAAEADLLIAAQEWPAAAIKLEAMIADYPNAAPALNNAAFVLQQMNDLDRALAYARRARGLAPDNPMVNDTLGWILVESGDAEAGLGFLREATVRAADAPELQYHLAVALHRLGRETEARAALQKALGREEAFPGRADAEALRSRLHQNAN